MPTELDTISAKLIENQVSKLQISSTLDQQGCIQLFKSLKNSTNLEEIDLSNQPIGAKIISHFAQHIIPHLPKLRVLKLNSIKMGSDGMTAIAKSLASNPSIVKIEARQNSIGSNAIQTISQMLFQNNTLTHLDLGDNMIKDDDLAELSLAMAAHPKLHTLIIDKNQLKPKKTKPLMHETVFSIYDSKQQPSVLRKKTKELDQLLQTFAAISLAQGRRQEGSELHHLNDDLMLFVMTHAFGNADKMAGILESVPRTALEQSSQEDKAPQTAPAKKPANSPRTAFNTVEHLSMELYEYLEKNNTKALALLMLQQPEMLKYVSKIDEAKTQIEPVFQQLWDNFFSRSFKDTPEKSYENIDYSKTPFKYGALCTLAYSEQKQNHRRKGHFDEKVKEAIEKSTTKS